MKRLISFFFLLKNLAIQAACYEDASDIRMKNFDQGSDKSKHLRQKK